MTNTHVYQETFPYFLFSHIFGALVTALAAFGAAGTAEAIGLPPSGKAIAFIIIGLPAASVTVPILRLLPPVLKLRLFPKIKAWRDKKSDDEVG